MPMNQRNPEKELHWRSYWESFAHNPDPLAAIDGWYFSRAHYWRKNRELVELLEPKGGERIVNIGCGVGLLETIAAQPVEEWIALDFAWQMVRRTRELHQDNDRILAVQGSALALPLASARFDKAVAHGVTAYLDLGEVGELMREMARVTRSGATLIIGDVAEYHGHQSLRDRLKAVHAREGIEGVIVRIWLRLTAPFRLLARSIKRRYMLAKGRLQVLEKPTPISTFTREDLIEMARRNQLAVKFIDKSSGSFYRDRFTMVLTKSEKEPTARRQHHATQQSARDAAVRS
jgi:ubiquinone/menaquinone biosynthesis C-methylase UbiE